MTKSTYSNYGCTVVVWAPGGNIISCIGNSTGTEILSGTSMATAFVSGVAALVKQLFPTFTNADIANYIIYTSGKNELTGFMEPNRNQRLQYVATNLFVPGQPIQDTCPSSNGTTKYAVWQSLFLLGILSFIIWL